MGLSYQDARQVAIDVFQTNFEVLSQRAAAIAMKRVEEFTDTLMEQLRKEQPQGCRSAEDPDFQLSLFAAQREYARCGEKQLGDILVDLLVQRSKQNDRDILQIVLSECIEVVAKLTEEQLAALAAVFIVRYTEMRRVHVIDQVVLQLKQCLSPIIQYLSDRRTCYQHLEYTGCATVEIAEIDILTILEGAYRVTLTKGLDPVLFTREFAPLCSISNLLVTDGTRGNRVWFTIPRVTALIECLAQAEIPGALINLVTKQLEATYMTTEEVRAEIVSQFPEFQSFLDIWRRSQLRSLQLTSVGTAIAHAYLRSKCAFKTDLSIWVN